MIDISRPSDKNEFREAIAHEFLNILQTKGENWKCGWIRVVPMNGITKHCYRGINRFYLSLLSMRHEISDPRWYTMTQIKNKSWHLKAGTKAVYVEYWYQYDLVEQRSLTWKEYQEEIDSGRAHSEFRLSSRYTGVFNAKDIEGVPALQLEARTPADLSKIVSEISKKMNVPILYDGGDRAFYSPTQDRIHLPAQDLFKSEYELNATAAHELGHATGHSSRLNRDQSGRFGSADYAYEELVAEMCSCFMSFDYSDRLTDNHLNNHKAYIRSWMEAITEKPDVLSNAVKDAQKAADYMENLISKQSNSKEVKT